MSKRERIKQDLEHKIKELESRVTSEHARKEYQSGHEISALRLRTVRQLYEELDQIKRELSK